jgi:hypothetical protein
MEDSRQALCEVTRGKQGMQLLSSQHAGGRGLVRGW